MASLLEDCERERHLIQLQINSLLNITQAINNNVKSDGLFKMYQSFLGWEMNIKQMALFFREHGVWKCVSLLGADETLLDTNDTIADNFMNFTALGRVNESEHPFLRQFELVIPVLHKREPIAHTFIGGFSEHDDIYSKVQFITTITNMIAVAIENKRLAKQKSREELLNREVELASEIQKTLVPSILPSGEKYQLSSIYKPHLGVGGDYFDVIEFPDGKFAFCVADISGKGVGAALLMANFQANLHSLIHRFKGVNGERLDLCALATELNNAVHRVTKGDKYLTLFIAEFCLETRELTYVNAGHVPSILLKKTGEIEFLDKGTTIIGAFEELPFIEMGTVLIEKEALIFNYTDGLTDVQNDDGDEFSDAKLMSFVRGHAHLPVKMFNEKLLDVVEAFRGKQPLPDDITVLTCKVA
jgi:phosphoserine phosphatase RsbU/P